MPDVHANRATGRPFASMRAHPVFSDDAVGPRQQAIGAAPDWAYPIAGDSERVSTNAYADAALEALEVSFPPSCRLWSFAIASNRVEP